MSYHLRLMKRWLVSLFVAALGVGEMCAQKGYGPWHIGMTKDQVTAVSNFGPYVSVPSTGGVETFNARWNGKKTNISFVFADNRLIEIQIWAYEGKNIEDASEAWLAVRAYLRSNFGEVETPVDSKLATASPNEAKQYFLARLGGPPLQEPIELQMAPLHMPDGLSVFCSFFRHPQHGYYVFLYFNEPNRT